MRRGLVTVILGFATSFALGALFARATRGWDAAAELSGHRGDVTAVALSDDGRLAASAGQDGQVIVWDVAARRLLHRRKDMPRDPISLRISPDGNALAVGYRGQSAAVWPFANGAEPVFLGKGSRGAELLAVSREGKRLALVNKANELQVWRVEERDHLPAVAISYPMVADGGALRFAPGERAVVFWNGTGGSSHAWDANTLRPLHLLGDCSSVDGAAISWRGRVIHRRAFRHNTKLVWPGGAGRPDEELSGTMVVPTWGSASSSSGLGSSGPWTGPQGCVAFGGDPNLVLMGLSDGSVVILRPATALHLSDSPRLWIALGLAAALLFWISLRVVFRRPSAPVIAAPPPGAPLPVRLRVVAYLFTAQGILAAIGMIAGLFLGGFRLDFTAVNILAARGLLGRSRGWRVWALVCCWLGFVVIGLMAGGVLEQDGTLVATLQMKSPLVLVFPAPLGAAVGAAVVTALLLACGWVWWVMTDPRIEALFQPRRMWQADSQGPPSASAEAEP